MTSSGSRDLNTTAAARVIADVLQDQWAPSRIVYGTDEPIGFDSPRDWAEYVAEVLVQALGLTEEWGVVSDMGVQTDKPLTEERAKKMAEVYEDFTARRRFATPWEPQS